MPLVVEVLVDPVDHGTVDDHKRVQEDTHVLLVEVNLPVLVLELLRDLLHLLSQLLQNRVICLCLVSLCENPS